MHANCNALKTADLWCPLYCLTVSPEFRSHSLATWSDEAKVSIHISSREYPAMAPWTAHLSQDMQSPR
jgi:hypothetical protein